MDDIGPATTWNKLQRLKELNREAVRQINEDDAFNKEIFKRVGQQKKKHISGKGKSKWQTTDSLIKYRKKRKLKNKTAKLSRKRNRK